MNLDNRIDWCISLFETTHIAHSSVSDPLTKSWVLALWWAVWKAHNDHMSNGNKLNPFWTIKAIEIMLISLEATIYEKTERKVLAYSWYRLKGGTGTIYIFRAVAFGCTQMPSLQKEVLLSQPRKLNQG